MPSVAWPHEKIEKKLTELPRDGLAAVLVSTLQRGLPSEFDLQMLNAAKMRLERAGFSIAGGWLVPVPASEGQAHPPEETEQPLSLSTGFAQHLSSLVLSSSDYVEMALLNAEGEDSLEPVGLVDSLQRNLLSARSLGLSVDCLRVFYVHSSKDNVSDGWSLHPASGQGSVFVPTVSDDELVLENTTQRMFVADPETSLAGTNSIDVVKEVIDSSCIGDDLHLERLLGVNAARLILAPTSAEYDKFAADFQQLGATRPPVSTASWPWEKFRQAVRNLPRGRDRIPALMVMSDAFTPVQIGHLEMLEKAKRRLELAGYAVLGGFLSVSDSSKGGSDSGELSGMKLSASFREHLLELAVLNDSCTAVASLELLRESGLGALDVAVALQDALSKQFRFTLEGERPRVFCVCGENSSLATMMHHGLAPDQGVGMVVLPCDDDSVLLESPHVLAFEAEPVSHPVQASAKLLTAIQSGVQGAQELCACVPAAAARLLMEPTAQEQATWSEDLATLGISPRDSAQHMAKVRDRLKASFQAWVGQAGKLSTADLTAILSIVDPSLLGVDASLLTPPPPSSASPSPGLFSVDELLDWIFSHRQGSQTETLKA